MKIVNEKLNFKTIAYMIAILFTVLIIVYFLLNI
jgi:hypothetical protein